MSQTRHILVIDDERLVRWTLKEFLEDEGFEVSEAEDGIEGLSRIEILKPDLIIVDHMMPNLGGIDMLQKLRDKHDHTPAIMLTAVNQAKEAVRALKLGAFDYILKPINLGELKKAIDDALTNEVSSQEDKNTSQSDLEGEYDFQNMIGQSQAIELSYAKLHVIAKSTTINVLITGESGTGKELAARAIHNLSKRSQKSLITVNCTALTETLFSSELFGHVKGSFTDAKTDKVGLLEAADKGTLFLDEIGDLSIDVQAKLLRVLEDQMVTPIGGTKAKKIDVRIIAATNQELELRVQQGKFRRDLFHRLNVARVHLPPLRDRREDIMILVKHFISYFSEESDTKFLEVDSSAEAILQNYSWPGNVRELKNTIERATLFYSGEVLLPEHIELSQHHLSGQSTTAGVNSSDQISLIDLERKALEDALRSSDNNKSEAARKLKISRDTLRYRLKKHGLD